jgi:hypothetical protein
MVNKDITIQLLDKNAGYVEVLHQTGVPLNFGVAEIRDISKRRGLFSKSITLAGTKNNAKMLNHYYDLNVVSGVFNINIKQRCTILQNGVIVLAEGYMQLLSVNKVQNNMSEDDEVTYTVEIKDAVADFFTTINGKELSDLEIVTPPSLRYTSADIVASFNNTVADNYKFILPYINGYRYLFRDCHPAMYAKWYWDKIHESAGYSYQWADLSSNNVRFDRLLIPYNGDPSKAITQKFKDDNTFIVDNSLVGATIFFKNSLTTSPNLPVFADNFQRLALNFSPIQDPNGEWNGGAQEFSSIRTVFPPDKLDAQWEIRFACFLDNNESSDNAYISTNAGIDAYIGVINTVTGGLTTLPVPKINFDNIVDTTRVKYTNSGDVTSINFKTGVTGPNNAYSLPYAPNTSTLLATGSATYTAQPSAFVAGEPLSFRIFFDAITAARDFKKPGTNPQSPLAANVTLRLEVTYSKVTLSPSIDRGYLNGEPIDLNVYIPTKIKQTDFVKSICTMFNLYCEPDKNNPNNLIYKRRDQFYDQGRTVDWTEKFARDKEQEIVFLPELTSKSLVLSYKYDESDLPSKQYTDVSKKTYGQLRYVFNNEWVKGEERKELIFAPTINLDTPFGGNLPFYVDPQKPSGPLKIVQDGGLIPVSPGNSFFIDDWTGQPNPTPLTTYPFVGHFDKPDFPTYDINFGICDYYPSRTYTIQNNLYYLNWLRTISNINTGKMLTAYFWLTEADIHLLKMSDKVRIDNGYFYINRIIDYNAAAFSLTKVELISIERESNPGVNSGNEIKPFDIKDWLESIGSDIIQPGPRGNGTISTGYFPDRIKIKTAGRLGRGDSSSITDGADSAMIFGEAARLGNGFRGIIIGDQIDANESGIYIGEQKLTSEGLQYTGLKIIDGGADTVMNLNKTNEIDFIDAGLDVVRNLNGSKTRPFIDGGKKS